MSEQETMMISCDKCNGMGSSSSHVECEGGGFTSDEWSEMDYEFQEDYMSGKYDKRCNKCNGSGQISAKIYVECAECGSTLEQWAIDKAYPYCSQNCANENYSCNCGRCAWCME